MANSGTFNTYGLPTGVSPTDVASMFATYQTLVITTKINGSTGGDVWVLTQASTAVESQGGTGGASSTWKQVKTGRFYFFDKSYCFKRTGFN